MEWTRIVLVRHGETEWNQENRWQGSRGTPLSARGRRQCQAAAEALADAGIGVVYASDLERARQSAEIIAGRLGLPVRFDVNLRERDVGQWEGLTDEEVSERFPEDHVRHLAHPGTFAATGGESREEVFARVVEFIERLVADHAGEAVLVVAHAGPVK